MAWAQDATAAVERKTAGITNPETFTIAPTGTNRLLSVALNHYQDKVVSGVTFNGVSMTQLATYSPQTRGGSVFNFFYMVAPSTGSNTISITFNSAPSQFGAVAASFTGVDQTPTIHDSDGYNYTAASGQLSMTGLTVGDLILAMGGTQGANINAGTGTTLVVRQTTAGIQQTGLFSVNAAASSDTIDITHNSDASAMIGAAFGEASSTTIKTYLGTATANVKTVLNGTAIASRKTWNGIA